MNHLLVPLLLLCSVGAFAAEAPSGDKVIALHPAALPWDGQALTPACVKKPENRRDLPNPSMTLSNKARLVEPAERVVINKEGTLTLGGTLVTFTQVSGSVSYALLGGHPQRLKTHGEGLESIAIPTSSHAVIPVAFPIAEVQNNNNNQTSTVRLWYRSAQVMAGQLGADTVLLIDDDLDGVCTMGKDAISINSGVVFAPLGKWLPTSTALYQISDADKQWAKLTCAPSSEATVKLSVAGQGMLGEIHAVFSCQDVHAVVTSHRPVVTKSGNYKLGYGLVLDASRHVTYAGILPGKGKEFDAAAPIVLGGPYKLEFTATAATKQLTIEAGSLRLFGRNEEQYVCFRISGSPTVELNGKSFGQMQIDANRGTANDFHQPLPNHMPPGEMSVTLDLVIEGLGKVQGTIKVAP